MRDDLEFMWLSYMNKRAAVLQRNKLIQFSRNSIAYLSDGTLVNTNLPRFEVVNGRKGILVEEGTTNLIQNTSTLSNCSLWFLGIDNVKGVNWGSQITNGVARTYWQQLDTSSYAAIRFVLSKNSSDYAYTINKRAPYVISFDVRIDLSQTNLSLYARGTATSVTEKAICGISTNYSVTCQNGCVHLATIDRDNGFKRISIQIPSSFWDGSGNTTTFFFAAGGVTLGVYDISYRYPQLEQKSHLSMVHVLLKF